MTRQEKIDLLRKVEAGADLFNELNKDQVIICLNGKYYMNNKELTEEQANRFTGVIIHLVKADCEGSEFDNA